jgi:hypothetical protein
MIRCTGILSDAIAAVGGGRRKRRNESEFCCSVLH